jgi:oligopeptide transport system substrate-binding protein
MAHKPVQLLLRFSAILFVITSLLAGCGRPQTTAPTPAAPTPPTQPVVLRMNLVHEPPSLDPALRVGSGDMVVEQLFLGLTIYDLTTGEVVPKLATSWDVSEDGTVYTFRLRHDVFWIRYDPASGTFERIRPVTAHDVVYGVRRSLRPETGSPRAQLIYAIKNAAQINRTAVPTETYDLSELGVRALDDTTVQFELEYPANYFPAIVALPLCRPQPQEAIEEHGSAWTEPGNIVTNAAYVLSEWVHDSRITLLKNPYYYRAAEVQIERVEMLMVSQSTAFAMYEAGELDTCFVPRPEFDRVMADPQLSQELRNMPRPGSVHMPFVTTKPPFDDVHVRRAFSYAIDRQSLGDNAVSGGWRPANTLAPPGIFGSAAGDPEVGIYYDPEAARAELALAGYPDGIGFPPVTILVNDKESNVRAAETLQQMWQETLGVTVNIERQEPMAFLQTVSVDTPVEQLPHMWGSSWAGAYPDQNSYIHAAFNPTEGVNSPRMRLDDPQVGHFVRELDELIRAAAREPDPTRRVEMYRRAEHLLVYEIAAIAPGGYSTRPIVTKRYLKRNFPYFSHEDIENWRIER